MQKNCSTTVIIFYERRADFELLREMLKSDFKALVGIQISQMLPETFCQNTADSLLLLFAAEDIQLLVDYHQQLHEDELAAPLLSQPHMSYLLCGRQFRKEAFELCNKGLFNDYGSINPVYDHFNFRLSLQALVDKLKLMQQAKDLQEQLNQKEDTDDKTSIEPGKTKSNEDKCVDLIEVSEQLSRYLEDIFNELHKSSIEAAVIDLLSHLEKQVHKETDGGSAEQSVNSDNPNPTVTPTLHQSDESNAGSLANLLAKPREKKLRQPKIMIVDDQEFIRQVIGTILRPKGFEVDTAADGNEALTRAKLRRPDLILLDIDMPKMNGTKVLSTLKAQSELCDIPVIMLTSHTEKNHFKRCLILGAKDYIVKPTNAEILLSKIQKYVDRSF